MVYDCIAKAKAAQGQPAPSSAAIKNVQARINQLLVANGYCGNVNPDGVLGKQTCGAAMWAASVDSSFQVPGGCANPSSLPGSAFSLKSPPCAGGGTTPPPTTKTCPSGQHLDASNNCVADAPSTAKKSSAWPIFIGVGLVLGAVAVATGGKKKKQARKKAA